MRIVQHLQRVEHRADRHPDALAQLDDLGRRVGHHPRIDRGIELLPMLRPIGIFGEAWILKDVGQTRRFEERLEHLPARHRQGHVPVLAAVDADRMPRPALRVADPAEDVTRLGPHHRRVLVQGRQRFHVRDIDRLAAPNRWPGQQGRNTADHRMGARLAARMESRPPYGFPIRGAVQVEMAGPGVVREPVRTWWAGFAPDLAGRGSQTER